MDGCKSSDDVVKCESCLTTINDTLKSSADLLSFIDSKRKVLYREDHTLKPFASDELKHFQEAQERVKVLHLKLQEASNELATTLINLKRKFPSRIGKDRQSGRKKENKRKVKKLKEKRLQQRAYLLLEKLTSRAVAGELFDAIKTNNNFASITTINAELTGKLIRRLNLDPLLWLLKKGVFNKNITRTLQVVSSIVYGCAGPFPLFWI